METFQKKPISKTIKYFYGIGDLGFTLMTNCGGYFWIYFLTNVNKFSLSTILLMTTLPSIIGIPISPLFGAIINSIKPMKWGRYRSWLIVPIPIMLIFFSMQWSKIGGDILAPTLCVVFAFIGSLATNFMYVTNASLIAVIASTPEEKAQMSATRGMYNNLSKVMWAYVGTPFVALMTLLLNNETLAYRAVQFTFCVLCALGFYAHFKMTAGYEETGAQELAKPKERQAKTSGKQLWSSLIQNPHLLAMMFMDIARWIVSFTMQSATIYFFQYVAQNMALQTTYLFVANLCAIVGAYIMKFFVQKIGSRNTGIVAFFGLGIFLCFARAFYLNTMLVMTFLILAQLFLGIAYTTIPVLYADAVIYSEWKMGKNASGWIMGLMQVPLRASGLIKNLIITGMLAVGGYSAALEPKLASPGLKAAIGNMFIGIPGALMVAGALIFLLGYRLTAEKIKQYREEIAAKSIA
ncbi:MFS transporter [Oxobacter pfennigii]|nr:MFS transporter [Oxobacter pfennigii]